jgi:hypothetical protein
MSETLRPCPFCGGEAKFETYGGTACAVVCQSCHCGTPTMSLVDGMAAVNRWNLRAERTCRPVVASDGCGAWGVYCPECGHTLSGPHASRERAKRYAARRDIMPRYCPDCGARVVGNDDR